LLLLSQLYILLDIYNGTRLSEVTRKNCYVKYSRRRLCA